MIALFAPSLKGGGAERVMAILANQFVEHGYAVDIVLVQATGPYLTDLRQDVNVVDLQAGRTVNSLFRLSRYLRQRRPRALLATLDRANIAALLARAISRVDTRVVIRLANVLSRSLATTESRRSSTILSSLVKRYYRTADTVVAVSQGVANDAVKFASLRSEQVVTINNPVPTAHVAQLAREQVEDPWFSPSGHPVVLGVGRLTKQKDFPTLIRAFAKVVSRRPAHLVILGEGEQRNDLESLISELELEQHVSLPGFVMNPYAYMARAGVFVLSSQWEGFPNVLLEALAAGVPVVATDCLAGPADILENGRYGKLVHVGDHEAMAKAIIEQLDNRDRQSTKLQMRAAEFSPEAIARQYLRVLIP